MNKWLEWDIELVWFKWIENEWERERGRKEAYTLGMLLQRERERERERERKKERKKGVKIDWGVWKSSRAIKG